MACPLRVISCDKPAPCPLYPTRVAKCGSRMGNRQWTPKVWQKRLATLPLASYGAGETVRQRGYCLVNQADAARPSQFTIPSADCYSCLCTAKLRPRDA
jgi:hypothetical protein